MKLLNTIFMRKIFNLVAVLLLSSSFLSAQDMGQPYSQDSTNMNQYNRFYLSLYGGIAQFYGDVSSDVFFPGSMMKGKFPWSVSPRIGWDFNPRFGLRADMNLNSIWAESNRDDKSYFHASVMDFQGEFVVNMSNLMFPYNYNKKWNMTIFTGAGWMFYNAIKRDTNDAILNDPATGTILVGYDMNGDKTKRESERIWNAGFSVGYKITKHLDLGLEVKFNNTPTDKLDGTFHALSEFDNYSSVMLGLTYYLGPNEQEWKWNPIDPFFAEILDSIRANDQELVDLGNRVSNVEACCSQVNPGAVKAADDDADGIPNLRDLEPNSPKGAIVNWQGRTIMPNDPNNYPGMNPQDFVDDDGDGVPNVRDLEPNTPKDAIVNWQGRTITGGAGSSNDPSRPTNIDPNSNRGDLKVGMYFNSVYFPFDQSVIDQTNYAEIIKVAMYLKAHPGTRIKISGNTDERGTNPYNDALSDRRVKAVKKILLEDFGFKSDIFEEEALGEKVLFSKTTHWVNRRVDFFIVN